MIWWSLSRLDEEGNAVLDEEFRVVPLSATLVIFQIGAHVFPKYLGLKWAGASDKSMGIQVLWYKSTC